MTARAHATGDSHRRPRRAGWWFVGGSIRNGGASPRRAGFLVSGLRPQSEITRGGGAEKKPGDDGTEQTVDGKLTERVKCAHDYVECHPGQRQPARPVRPRSIKAPARTAKSRTSSIQIPSYRNASLARKSVRWAAKPMAPATIYTHARIVMERGRCRSGVIAPCSRCGKGRSPNVRAGVAAFVPAPQGSWRPSA